MTNDGRILVYTDGACSGNPGPGGWAAIVLTPDGRVRELGGGERATTNNRMEMRATIEALRFVEGRNEAVELFTDSTYVIHGITEWVAGWKRRGWVTAAKAPVLNKDLWETLDALAAARTGERRIEWKYVKGHAGHAGNERCDEIAVAFSQGVKPDLYDGPVGGYGHALLDKPPAPARSSGTRASSVRKPAAPGGRAVYLSLVGGKLERHENWADCNRRVKGVPNARYRKASSAEEEAEILRSWGFPAG